MQRSRLGVSKNMQENLQTEKIDVSKFNKLGKKVYKQISEKKNFTVHNKLSLLNKMDILQEIISKQNMFGLNKQQKKVLYMFEYARYESIKSFQNDQIIKPIDFYNGKKIFVSKIFLLKKSIQKMIDLLQSKINNFQKRNDIDSVCKKLLTYAQQSKNQILICVLFISYAKLQIIWKNFPEAIEKLKHLKNIIKEEKLLHYKMIAYYQLGKCFSEIQRHNLSLVYFGKSLRLAWSLDDIDQEIKCYDFIGLQMYYLNKLVEAKYFHQRMIQGKYEEFDSDQRNLSKSKIKNKLQSYKNYQKLNLKSLKHKLQQQDIFNNYIVSSSEDEFDIPVNTVDHEDQENDLTQNYKLIGNKVREIDGESSQFDLLTQNNRLQKGFMNQQKVKANKNIRMIADQQREIQTANEYYKNYEPGKYKITQKNRDDFDPVQRQSHLSINRNPNNFQKEDGRTLKLNDQEYNKVIYDSLDRFSRKNIMIQLKKLLSQFKFCNDLILNSGDLKIDIEKYSALYEEEQNKILENRKKIKLMENEEELTQQFGQLQNSKYMQKLKPIKDDLFEEEKKEIMQQSFVINSTTSLADMELKKQQSNQQQKLQLHSNPLLIQSANINADQ